MTRLSEARRPTWKIPPPADPWLLALPSGDSVDSQRPSRCVSTPSSTDDEAATWVAAAAAAGVVGVGVDADVTPEPTEPRSESTESPHAESRNGGLCAHSGRTRRRLVADADAAPADAADAAAVASLPASAPPTQTRRNDGVSHYDSQ